MVDRRAPLALLCLSLALAVGCSGGGGGTPHAPATQAPTVGPSGSPTPLPVKSVGPSSGPTATSAPTPVVTASPTPVPTAPPSAAALTNTARPLHNGDVYAYAGTTQQNFVYGGTAPSPAASTLFAVKQAVTVASNAAYNNASGLYDFKTVETDTAPNQSTSITTDTYYGTSSGGGGLTNLLDYGFTSTDTRGEKLAFTYASPIATNGLVDVLPETTGTTWGNYGAQTIQQSEADGFKATRTYAADGTYVDTATYPQAGAANPAATPLTATIATNADGSATYALPLFGPPNVTISYSAPGPNGAISIVTTQPGPSPASTPAVIASTTVGAWYQQQPNRSPYLYQELDRDNGAVAIPAACAVSAAVATQANQIEQKSVRVDPVLGTIESIDQFSYVVPMDGVVCVQLQDRTLTYYDYSGQGNGAPTGISYSGGNSPLETATVTTTIGLTSQTIQPFAVARQLGSTSTSTSGASASAVGFRLANARANFLTLVEHHRIAAQRRAFAGLRAMTLRALERTTR